ncbi:MAG TPA: peptidase [Candidatus Blautia merdavium]|uniref:Peptidase n=1 Tax=Candidatus Blautia merdavium TaxID=2838494 RepID=A0A9D2TD41_9FIRM|nr:peptidase [Candidatus Blautia merdavium]
MYNTGFGRFSGYTYENMENDLELFEKIFPGILSVDSLGKTADEREIYHLTAGRREAQDKILIFGGIHGREYMTSQLIMEQTAEFLSGVLKGRASARGDSYAQLLEGSAVHIIPMANPDGVTISQMGPRGIRNRKLREAVWQIAKEEGGRLPCGPYFTGWKANARGVDLNRNFDAEWERYEDRRGKPSSREYKGAAPECEAESAALAELTRKERFKRTISYHSSGAVIYWNFGQVGELYRTSRSFAGRIAAATGYDLEESYDCVDPAGYKDWALQKMQIPSITIEIGRAGSPLPACCFREVLRENRTVWEETLYSLLEETFSQERKGAARS